MRHFFILHSHAAEISLAERGMPRQASHNAGDQRASIERENLLRTLRAGEQQQQQQLDSPPSAPSHELQPWGRQRRQLSVYQEPPHTANRGFTQGDGPAPMEGVATSWVAPEVNFVMGWFAPEASKRRSARSRA